MRKLLSTTAILALVVCCTVDADAFDVKNRFMIAASGGLSIPVGDIADDDTSSVNAGGAGIGPGLGIAVEYGITNELLVGGRFAYNRFAVDEALLKDGEAHWSVIEILGLYGKYLIATGTSTRPYGRAGLFLGKPELKFDGSEGARSGEFDVSLGLEAALGVTHMISPQFGIGLEGRFAHLSTNEKEPSEALQILTPAGIRSIHGVRDPGGNIQWLAVNGYVTYGF